MTHVNLLALLHQADIRSPEILLDYALPKILTELNDVNRIEVFRLARGGMVVWNNQNSPNKIGEFVRIDSNSAYQQAIDMQQVSTSDEGKYVVAPLVYQQEVFALLVLSYATNQASQLDVVSELAADLGLMLYTQEVDTVLHQQIELTGKLAIATSLTDITSVVAKTMVLKGQFLSINIFEYEDNGALSSARILATANREKSFPANIPMGINFTALEELHHLLTSDGEVLISDVVSETRFSEDARQWLHEQGAKSMYVIPMWIDNHLYAFISLIDGKNALALSPLERELYQNVAHQAAITIEKQHLLERTQQTALQSEEQVRVLGLINELMGQATRSTDEQSILQKMTEILLEVTRVDHVGVVMREGDTALVVSEAPKSGLLGKNIELGTDSIHNLLQETRAPFITTDVANHLDMPAETRKALLEVDIPSIVILPMFDEANALIGTISLDYFTKQNSIDSNMVDIAQTIVSQVTLTLQNKRLLSASQQQTQQLSQLTEFGQALRANLVLADILDVTLDYCPALMTADYVGVLLYDRSVNGLRTNASHLNGHKTIRMDADILSVSDNSIAIDAWTQHQAVKVDDLHKNWDLKHPLQRELQSILVVPLNSGGMTLGVIEVGDQNPYHFNAIDMNTLQQISNQVAIAISNAEAYAQSQRLARNKTQANEIISKLQQQLEVSDILAVTVQELGKAIGAKKGRIRIGAIPKKLESGD